MVVYLTGNNHAFFPYGGLFQNFEIVTAYRLATEKKTGKILKEDIEKVYCFVPDSDVFFVREKIRRKSFEIFSLSEDFFEVTGVDQLAAFIENEPGHIIVDKKIHSSVFFKNLCNEVVSKKISFTKSLDLNIACTFSSESFVKAAEICEEAILYALSFVEEGVSEKNLTFKLKELLWNRENVEALDGGTFAFVYGKNGRGGMLSSPGSVILSAGVLLKGIKVYAARTFAFGEKGYNADAHKEAVLLLEKLIEDPGRLSAMKKKYKNIYTLDYEKTPSRGGIVSVQFYSDHAPYYIAEPFTFLKAKRKRKARPKAILTLEKNPLNLAL